MRRLDELAPEPPLLPPAGDAALRDACSRPSAGATRSCRRCRGGIIDVGLPAPARRRWRATRATPSCRCRAPLLRPALPLTARADGAQEQGARRRPRAPTSRRCPASSTASTAGSPTGCSAASSPNAADLQIGSTIRLLLSIGDVRRCSRAARRAPRGLLPAAGRRRPAGRAAGASGSPPSPRRRTRRTARPRHAERAQRCSVSRRLTELAVPARGRELHEHRQLQAARAGAARAAPRALGVSENRSGPAASLRRTSCDRRGPWRARAWRAGRPPAARLRPPTGSVSDPRTVAPWRGTVSLSAASAAEALTGGCLERRRPGTPPSLASRRRGGGAPGVVPVVVPVGVGSFGGSFARRRHRDRAFHRRAVDGAIERVGARGGELAVAAPVGVGRVDRHRRFAARRRRTADPFEAVRCSGWCS